MREAPESEWKSWTWRTEKDLFLNGAYFRESGSNEISNNNKAGMFTPMDGTMVGELTRFAGPRKWLPGNPC